MSTTATEIAHTPRLASFAEVQRQPGLTDLQRDMRMGLAETTAHLQYVLDSGGDPHRAARAMLGAMDHADYANRRAMEGR